MIEVFSYHFTFKLRPIEGFQFQRQIIWLYLLWLGFIMFKMFLVIKIFTNIDMYITVIDSNIAIIYISQCNSLNMI